MPQRMAQRADTLTNWFNSNPLLATGEIGLETDTGKYKFGDGTLLWNALPYSGPIGVTALHNNLAGLDGGGAAYYHSDQHIDVANDVQFHSIGAGSAPDLTAQLVVRPITRVGTGTVETSGSSTTVTITGGTFDDVESGSIIIANSISRLVFAG